MHFIIFEKIPDFDYYKHKFIEIQRDRPSKILSAFFIIKIM